MNNKGKDCCYAFVPALLAGVLFATMYFFEPEDLMSIKKCIYCVIASIASLIAMCLIFRVCFYLCEKTTFDKAGQFLVIVTKDDDGKIPNKESVTELIFDDTVVSILQEDIKDCEKLKSVTFYSQNINLSSNDFSSCKNLEEVTFHANIAKSAETAFQKCPSLRRINFIGTWEDYKGLSIEYPSYCKIRFIPLPEINKSEPLKEYSVKVDATVHGVFNGSNQCETVNNFTSTTVNNTTTEDTDMEINTDISNTSINDSDISVNIPDEK